MSFVEVRRHFEGVTNRDLQIITPGRVIGRFYARDVKVVLRRL